MAPSLLRPMDGLKPVTDFVFVTPHTWHILAHLYNTLPGQLEGLPLGDISLADLIKPTFPIIR